MTAVAGSATPPPLTTLSDTSIRYTVPESGYVVLQRGDVQAVVVDNRAVNDPAILPVHAVGYNGLGSLTLVYNFSDHRFNEPWYIGEARGIAFVQRFREADEIRFTQSPRGGGSGNPACDFQWFITSPEVGQRYQFVMRTLYVPLAEGDPEAARDAVRQSQDNWGRQ